MAPMTSYVRLRFGVVAEVADLILVLVAAAEAYTVVIIDEREDAPAH
jgi:hypothetical protein